MRPIPRIAALTVSALVAGAAVALGATPAVAASADVTISQVYGGGGNSGATYTNDYVQLRNDSAAAVDVTGWSVQYASAAGTSWAATALSGSIAPGGYFLVQLGTPDRDGGAGPLTRSGTSHLASRFLPFPLAALIVIHLFSLSLFYLL